MLRRGATTAGCDGDGATALHIAVANHQVAWVDALLRAGASCNGGNKSGLTPLHLAVQASNEEIVDILLRAGVYPDAQDGMGRTALRMATLVGHKAIARSLLLKGADPFSVPRGAHKLIDRARRAVLLQLLLAACARGQIFSAALYDRRLWRLVSRYLL
jgi:ankyrin repeat protein